MILNNVLNSLTSFGAIADVSRSGAFSDITSISALVWTCLLFIGLFFFIRASGKDRTERRQWYSDLPVDDVGVRLHQYLQRRAYQLAKTDESGIATFVGRAQPSGFLTGLLTILAAVGLSCLAIVFNALLYPNWQGVPFILLFAAPVAGWYYRLKSDRTETIRLKVEAIEEDTKGDRSTKIGISGHRDALDAMVEQLPLEEVWD